MKTTWDSLSARKGRNDLPVALAMAVLVDGVLKDVEEIRTGVEDAWTSAEWPVRLLSTELWQMLFHKTGFIEDGKAATPPESITLYRGCVEGRERGMSWTDNLERAQWFGSRFRGNFGAEAVYTVTVPGSALLAHFPTRRNEHEWVVDPDALEDIEVTKMETVEALAMHAEGGQ